MKKWIIRLLKIGISICLLMFLFRNKDLSELGQALKGVSIDGIFIIVLAYLLSVTMNGLKWHVLLPDTEVLFLIALSFRAQFYSTILPGQLFGEASKVTVWSERKEDTTMVTASVLFDKITSVIGQLLMGTIGLFFSATAGIYVNRWVIVLIAVIILLCLMLSAENHVAIGVRKMISILGKVSQKVGAKIGDFYSAWCLFSTQKRMLLKSVIWGVVNQWIGVVSIWYLSYRMGLRVGLVEYCWISPLMSIILLLPISFAGVGLRDASLAVFLSLFDVSSENAVVLSMAHLLAQFIAAGIGGLYILGGRLKSSNDIDMTD